MHVSRNQCVMSVQLVSDPAPYRSVIGRRFKKIEAGTAQPKWPTSATKSANSGQNERGRQLRRPRNDTLTAWGTVVPVRPTVALPITAALVLTPTVLVIRAPFPGVLMNDHAGI